jgi:hypothetical protein
MSLHQFSGEGSAMAAPNASVGVRTQSPSYEACQILQLAFVVAPLIAAAEKFFHVVVNWDQYLSPVVTRMFISGHTFHRVRRS